MFAILKNNVEGYQLKNKAILTRKKQKSFEIKLLPRLTSPTTIDVEMGAQATLQKDKMSVDANYGSL